MYGPEDYDPFTEVSPGPQKVKQFHENADTDSSPFAVHHTLGNKPWQAAPGDHTHEGEDHTHTGFALEDHNHAGLYSPTTHNHDGVYAPVAHNHDASYSGTGHVHDDLYSTIAHHHDLDYSDIAHNHDPDYAPTVHSHGLTTLGDYIRAGITPASFVASDVTTGTITFPVAFPGGTVPSVTCSSEYFKVIVCPNVVSNTGFTYRAYQDIAMSLNFDIHWQAMAP